MDHAPAVNNTPPTVALRAGPDPAEGWLVADQPVRRWTPAGAEALLGQPLDEALAELARRPRGLVVGLLPYPPGPGRQHAPPTPTSLLLFSEFRQVSDLPAADAPGFSLSTPFQPDTSREAYLQAVRRVLDYLAAGDAYQVNVAQRFSAGSDGHPWHAFRSLATRFQPPCAVWLDLGNRQLLSFSPESFLEIDRQEVVTRPIKGTRPRGNTADADARLAADLASNPKDRAENLMIVDLLRNDLGKVCVPGSVRTPTLFEVESFSHVHHLVSAVRGTLPAGTGPGALLAATFPGGSITGAPKRRAMEIIDELESHPRDIYCGTVFWITADGRMRSNILIRSFLATGNHLYGWAGAGIVADSSPEAEYQECLDKLGGLMRAFEGLR